MTIRVALPEDEVTYDERCLDPQMVERYPGMHPGDAIVCTCGRLWVTQEGDPEDYMLGKGGAFVANRQGVVVVQALIKAKYCLSIQSKPRKGEELWMTVRRPQHLTELNVNRLTREVAVGNWRQVDNPHYTSDCSCPSERE